MEASANALAGGIGSVAAMALLYPLERCRIVLQVKKRDLNASEPDQSVANTIRQLVREEGVVGLYRGLLSALTGVSVSSFVYFFWYSRLKKMATSAKGDFNPLKNMIVASVAGSINVFMTTPIWVIQTRLAAESSYKGITDCVIKTMDNEGVSGFFKGLVPALILVSNPAIQFVTYEQCTKILQNWHREAISARTGKPVRGHISLSAVEYFLLGAFSKAFSTVFTYPYQVIKSRMQLPDTSTTDDRDHYKSVMHAFKVIVKKEGLRSLYSGLQAKMFQTVLNSAILFLLYQNLLSFFISALKKTQA